MTPAEITIVVPVYNEVPANLTALLHRLDLTLIPLSLPYEVVFVDDGSRALTANFLRETANSYPNVRLVVLSRNFGEQAAIIAGLTHARGRAIINMDSDLQDPPELLPTMIQYWREGNDIVFTRQTDRSDAFIRKMATELFYWLLNKSSPVTISHAGEFRLLSKRAAAAVISIADSSPFLRSLVPWVGFKQVVITFKRDQRTLGNSSYSFEKLFKVGLSGLFSSNPFVVVAFPIVGSFLVAIATVVALLHWHNSITVALIALLVGIINLVTSVSLTVYLGFVVTELRKRPLYIVADVIEKNAQLDLVPNTAPSIKATGTTSTDRQAR